MPLGTDDEFGKELIDLFVQEAHEWLQQIHVALDELQQSPPPDRHVKLVEIIKAGITNLGGSAATINLHEVEQTSFSTIPFVEAVQNPGTSISVNAFLALCKHLGRIHRALTNATGVSFEAEAGASVSQPASGTIASIEFLAALRRLHDRGPAEGSGNRKLAQAVIAQVEGLIKNRVEQCEIASFREFLERVGGEEDAFLRAVREQIPIIVEEIERVKAANQSAESSPDGRQSLVDRVAQLCSGAQQVNAASAAAFFKGLHSFLSIVSQGRVAVAAQRFDAVEARLPSVAAAVQAWVDAGREERAAISAVLLSHA